MSHYYQILSRLRRVGMGKAMVACQFTLSTTILKEVFLFVYQFDSSFKCRLIYKILVTKEIVNDKKIKPIRPDVT